MGRQLFELLIRDSVAIADRRCLDHARAQGRGVRMRLRIDRQAAKLATLPWELLYDPAPEGGFLGRNASTPMVRHLAVAQPRESLTVKPPLRVLAMAARPVDLAAISNRIDPRATAGGTVSPAGFAAVR